MNAELRRMVEEAGIFVSDGGNCEATTERLEAFARLVAEDCMQIARDHVLGGKRDFVTYGWTSEHVIEEINRQIAARYNLETP